VFAVCCATSLLRLLAFIVLQLFDDNGQRTGSDMFRMLWGAGCIVPCVKTTLLLGTPLPTTDSTVPSSLFYSCSEDRSSLAVLVLSSMSCAFLTVRPSPRVLAYCPDLSLRTLRRFYSTYSRNSNAFLGPCPSGRVILL